MLLKNITFRSDVSPAGWKRAPNGTRMAYDFSYDGVQFFGSARDVGNLVAGYYAAAYGMTWEEAREAFDSYNGSKEPLVSKYGQRFGFNLGNSLPEEERRLRRNLNFMIPASLPAYQSIKKTH